MKTTESRPKTNHQSVDSGRDRAQSPDNLSIEAAASSATEFADNRPATIAQRQFQAVAIQSAQAQGLAQHQSMVDKSPRQVAQRQQFSHIPNPPTQPQCGAGGGTNRTGLPDSLKDGLEQLSGMDLSDVRVHANSTKPAQLNAMAYAQGQEIHLGPGQEKHLPHEGWHVVQQMQGRVKPTIQAKSVSINDDEGLEREADVMGAKAAAHQPSIPGESNTKNAAVLTQTIPASFVNQRKLDVVQTQTPVIQLNTAQDRAFLSEKRNNQVPKIIEVMSLNRSKHQEKIRLSMTKKLAEKSKSLVGVGSSAVMGVHIDNPVSSATQDHLKDVQAKHMGIAKKSDATARINKIAELIRDFSQQCGQSYIDTLTQIANEKYNNGERKTTDEDINIMFDRVYKSALNAANEKSLALLLLAEQSVKNKLASDDFLASTQQQVKQEATELTIDEVAFRASQDELVQAVITESLQTTKKNLRKALTHYLEKKVGALGVDITRSKAVRKFYGKLKEASQEQITKQSTNLLADHFASQSPGDQPATQKYNKMRQKQGIRKIRQSKPIKKQAGGKISEALKEMAGCGVAEVLPKFEKALEQTATTAAWSILRTMPSNANESVVKQKKATARKLVIKDLKACYKALLPQAKKKGDDWSRKTIKGDKSGNEQQAEELQQVAAENVKTKVKKSDIASGVVKMTLAAASPEKSVGAIGTLLDTLVPHPGDSVFLNLELRIPIYNTGVQVYVLIGLKGQAHRGRKGAVNAAPDVVANDTWLEVRGDITVGCGAQILGLSGDLALNFFARVGAKDTAKTMKAFSLSMYKLMGEENKKLATLWANGGKVDNMSTAEMAEIWAAMAEEQAFTQGDATVDLGVLGKARGQAALGNKNNISIEAGGGHFWRLNKGVLDKQKAAKEAKANKLPDAYDDETKEKIAAAKAAGKSKKVVFIKVSVATQVGVFSASLAIVKNGPWDLKISATVPLPAGNEAGAQAISIAAGVTNTFRALHRGGVAHMKEESSNAKKTGTGADILGQLPSIAEGLGAKLNEAAKEVGKRDKALWQQGNAKQGLLGQQVDQAKKSQTGILGFKHKCKLTLNGGYQAAAVVGDKASKISDGLVIRGEFISLQGVEYNLPMGKIKVEKGRSLFSLGWQKGMWKCTVLY